MSPVGLGMGMRQVAGAGQPLAGPPAARFILAPYPSPHTHTSPLSATPDGAGSLCGGPHHPRRTYVGRPGPSAARSGGAMPGGTAQRLAEQQQQVSSSGRWPEPTT